MPEENLNKGTSESMSQQERGQIPLVTLSASIHLLQEAFNSDADKARLLLLVSPT
jgi:hypothetical protein